LRAEDVHCLALGEGLRRNIAATAGWGHNPNEELADLYAAYLRSNIRGGGIASRWAERAAALEALKATAAQLQAARTELQDLLAELGRERDEKLQAGHDKLTATIAKLVRRFSETEESAARIAQSCDQPQRLHQRLGRWRLAGDPVIDARNFLGDLDNPIRGHRVNHA
jgi:ABC-type transporter Mla subunit MlaD